MRCKCFFLNLLFLVNVGLASAQNPASDHVWISTGKVSARITSTGVHADSTGGFLLENATPSAPPLNLLSHLAPWIGGIDPGGNLKLACEMDDPAVSDWQSGFRDIPGSGKVWKVTREQIVEHIADFQDNGVVDNPIPAIFAWPGRGNPYSMQWNNFEVPYNFVSPPYYDENNDADYNPADGDYPVAAIRGAPFELFPEQIVYSPFFDNGLNTLTHTGEMRMNAMLIAFTFECAEQGFVKNTIFFAYKFRFVDTLRTDPTFFGFFADFDLGNPHDDYLGCAIPFLGKIYCYNSDTLHDAVAGENPPMTSLMPFRGLLDTAGSQVFLSHVMPVFDNNFPLGMTRPQLPIHFYRYITGSWRDGAPLETGWTGYQSGGAQTDFAFTGHPSYSDGWSEMSSGNPLGDRECVFSYGPLVLRPEAINEVVFALSVSEAHGPSAQLAQLSAFKYLQAFALDGGIDVPSNPLDSLCQTPVSIVQPASSIVSIFPNPAHSQVTLRAAESGIRDVALFDVFGKKILAKQNPHSENQEIALPLTSLPTGIYFLQWTIRDGRRGCGRVILE